MKAWFRKILGGVDRLVLWSLDVGQYVLLWPFVYAVAWAAALWPLRHEDRVTAWGKNELVQAERDAQLELLLWSLGVMFAILVAYWAYCVFFRTEWEPARWRRNFSRFFAFSVAGPFIVALTTSNIEVRRPFHTMFFITVAAVCLLPTAAVSWEAAREWRENRTRSAPEWVGSLAASAVVVFLIAGYSYWFARITINGHHALHTRIFDLGIYDNIFYQSSHGNFLGCTLSRSGSHIPGHFDPILALLSPLYLIDPRAETVLRLQAIWCALGVVPAYLVGRHHVGTKWAGVVFAVAWAVYPALHGANSYEFHSLTLLAPLLLFLLYFLTTGRVKSFFALLPIVLLVREDVSLLVCCLGFTALLTRDPRLTRLGWVTFGIAAVYFVVTKTLIMPSVQNAAASAAATMATVDPLGGKTGFAWYYKDLIPKGGGLRDMLAALLTNPTFALDLALRQPKVIFLLQLFLPLAFLPLFAKPWRFAMAFGLFYILLATRSAVFSIGFQYSVVLFPVLFALAPIGIVRLRDSSLPARLGMPSSQFAFLLLTAVLSASLLMSWKFGGIADNDAFKGGWKTPPRTLSKAAADRYQGLVEFLGQIPPDASVSVVGRLGPHVSNRAEVYRYRHRRPSEFLLFDRRDMKGSSKRDFDKDLKKGKYELVDKRSTFELYRPSEGKPDAPEVEDESDEAEPRPGRTRPAGVLPPLKEDGN